MTRLLTDDATRWISGTTEFSSTYGIGQLLAIARGLFANTEGAMDVTFGAITAEQNRVCVEVRARASFATGGNMEALQDGHLAAAGLDVFAEEPANPAEMLLALPNIVLTPHMGWLTTGTFDRSFALAAENCPRLAVGETLLHRVA